jgi:hypothetical protein
MDNPDLMLGLRAWLGRRGCRWVVLDGCLTLNGSCNSVLAVAIQVTVVHETLGAMEGLNR